MNESERKAFDQLEHQHKQLAAEHQALDFQHRKLVKTKYELTSKYEALEQDHKELQREHERLKLITSGLLIAMAQFKGEANRLHQLACDDNTQQEVWIPEAMVFFENFVTVFGLADGVITAPTLPPRAPTKFSVKLRDERSEDGFVEQTLSGEELEKLLDEQPTRIIDITSAKRVESGTVQARAGG